MGEMILDQLEFKMLTVRHKILDLRGGGINEPFPQNNCPWSKFSENASLILQKTNEGIEKFRLISERFNSL